jgi:hypothetical protein
VTWRLKNYLTIRQEVVDLQVENQPKNSQKRVVILREEYQLTAKYQVVNLVGALLFFPGLLAGCLSWRL